ncbi:MAG: S8 family serine peptidase [Pseudomonadota bacterium]
MALDPSDATLDRARALGFTVAGTFVASDLSLRIVRFRTPLGINALVGRRLLSEDNPELFELNSFFALQAGQCDGQICGAHQQIGWPSRPSRCGAGVRIGIVDTTVDTSRRALRAAQIQTRRFTPKDAKNADGAHGTAVAGLLVGDVDSAHPGLLRSSRLFAADPFYRANRTAVADTAGVVQALNWLVGRRAAVIGMPLAGPRNQLLELAIETAVRKGVVIVAAAGNAGPGAAPAYPAAIDGVIAVTAIDDGGRVYRRANQGDYIDFALPGVDVWTIGRGDGRARSGTSFAVPFMMALLAEGLRTRRTDAKVAVAGRNPFDTVDLGRRGRDAVFGWGLPRHRSKCG